jgi:hypothetical protein
MEKAIKKLMGNNLPPRFKFKDTYDSIEVPTEYQQYLPTQQQLETEFDEMLDQEEALPTIDAVSQDLQVISANVYSNTATGAFGIGTATPDYTLHVDGDAGITSNLTVGTANLFVDTTTSNVGVGTSTPAYTLDVHGTANVGALTATSVSGPLSGNAATATALETARTIGGVSFDGSANINLPGVNTIGNQDTTGNADTAAALETARNINGVSFDGTGNITITANTPNTLTRGLYLTGSNFDGGTATTWAVDATTAATASKIVARDGNGDIFGRYVNMSHNASYTEQ